jgi:hypothetical protein
VLVLNTPRRRRRRRRRRRIFNVGRVLALNTPQRRRRRRFNFGRLRVNHPASSNLDTALSMARFSPTMGCRGPSTVPSALVFSHPLSIHPLA